ncbi:MAG: pilus assembly protein PilM [Candidatus Omnitrophica bacterium]|nr:pilus assembly protein PilM [Candidatus Omnitrophota bacterium]
MDPAEKSDNIVKKVFDRAKKGPEKVSPLFTYSKHHAPKVLAPQESKGPLVFNPLPAAIDVGTSVVKLIQLAQGQKGELELLLMDEEPYGTTALNRDLTLRQREAVQKLLKRNSIGPGVVVSLSAKEIQVFNFVFPAMSETELEEAVSWKIKQLKPFDMGIEAIKYGLTKWEAGGGSAQKRVTVVCAPLETILRRVELFTQTGLKVIAVEAAPVSLVNFRRLQTPSLSAEEVVLWLDLGGEESSIAVEKGGSVHFVRNLTITSRQLTRQLAQNGRVDEARAEELKRDHGLSFWTPERQTASILETGGGLQEKEKEAASVYGGLVSSLENLIIDIEHSFKYFSYQVSQSQITKFDRILISGGGANLKNLELFLSAKLGVPVEKANPFLNFRIQQQLVEKKNSLLEQSSGFAVATGLAASQALPASRRMNLLPMPEKLTFKVFMKKVKKDPRKAAVLAAGALLLLMAPQFAVASYYRGKVEQIEGRVRGATMESNRQQASQLALAEEETELLNNKTLLESRLQILKESTHEKKQFAQILADIAGILPEEIWITRLSYVEKKMTVVGLTSKNEAIIRFIDAMKQSSNFKEVTFNYTQQESDTSIYRFEVTTNVR